MDIKIKRNWLWDVVSIIIAVLVIRAYVVSAYKIPTGSMENTLLVGDFLFATKFNYGLKVPFVNKMAFKWNRPKRGDIVIFRYPLERKDFVKRCVAIPGDTVEIVNKSLYINGQLVDEPYVYHADKMIYPALDINDRDVYQDFWQEGRFERAGGYVRDNFGPVVVPEGHIFLMGDNRDNSFDSRFWGPLGFDNLRGKPFIIYWSWGKGIPMYRLISKIRWDRIGILTRDL